MVPSNFELAYEGWHVYREFYGDATAVEAELRLKQQNVYVGIGINIGFEGSYQLRITDKTFDKTGKYYLFISKRTTTLTTLTSIALEPEEYRVCKGEVFRLRLECDRGRLRGFLNGTQLLAYDDSESGNRFLTGWCGVWLSPLQSATIQKFQCWGTEKEKPTQRTLIKTNQFYRMNLDETGEDGGLPYWSTAPGYAAWAVDISEGKKVFHNPYREEESLTHLHMFEKEPCIKMEISVKELQGDSSFGVYLRHAPDTAYIKLGYDNRKTCWFLEDVPALYDCKTQRIESYSWHWSEREQHIVEIKTGGKAMALYVDGEEILTVAELLHTGFGRVGLWTNQTIMQVYSFEANMPYSTQPVDGVMKTYIDTEHFASSCEIEVATDGALIGVTKVLEQDESKPYHTGIYHSADKGISFQRVSQDADYSGLETFGKYQSVAKLHDGTYLQVVLKDRCTVQKSTDLIHWETVGMILDGEEYDEWNYIFHTSSLVEYADENGKYRIFMPIVWNRVTISGETRLKTAVQDTVIFYSDDGGEHWKRAEVSTAQIMEKVGHPELMSYAECKIVQCSDGSLRLYNSRNETHFLCYSESFDFGQTWEGLHTIKEMQCALSSFGVSEDPYSPGTYYMAWVNDEPISRGNYISRTRVSLARSYDGKQWHYLCDAERMSPRYPDSMPYAYIPLFQILDPAITVTKDYIYLTYGISMYSNPNMKFGDLKMFHHEQRPALARFQKDKLCDQPWSAANVCNISLLNKQGEEEYDDIF